MALFENTQFKLMEQGLDASWYKQKIISHNIANSTTPNYKTKNVNFGLVLEEAKCKCKYHTGEQSKDGYKFKVTTTSEENTNMTLDENNVDMEVEAMKLADTQYQYSSLIDHMNNEFTMIRAALQK